MVNSPLIRPYLLGGGVALGGGTLDSHENGAVGFYIGKNGGVYSTDVL